VSAALLAAWALGAVLVVAAVAKLRHPLATATDLAELGLAGPALLARLIPVAELATAGALFVAPPWGGVVAFALLAAFTAVLARVLRSGRAVSCACFGATSSRPISAATVARNVLLLAMAALATTA
jgi:hypothetical protein